MQNNKLFTKFDYLVGNLFLNLNKVEVKVYFIYLEDYLIKLPLLIRKVKNKDKSYYVAEAKKIIARMIEDGSLKKYSDEYIKEKKRKKFLLLLLLFFGIGALAGASVGIYFACKKPVTYDVSCDMSDITIVNAEAIEGQDYRTQITYAPTTRVTLPRELDKVLINGVESTDYTYTLNYRSLTAEFYIPAKYVTGKVEIFLTPSEIKKWYEHTTDWYYYCSSGVDGEEADESDIGKIVKLKVNNQDHEVRLIGLDHDDLSNGSGQAHTTFQFANLLCDENGYSFGLVVDFDHNYESCNYDYLNSMLRKNLTGNGTGEMMWFQRGEVNRSQKYKDTTVMDMLPQDLKKVLKEVRKEIYVGDTEEYDEFIKTDYYDKLFVPTYREMFKEGSEHDGDYYGDEGTTYDYYLQSEPTRIFNQISNEPFYDAPVIEDVFYDYGADAPNNWAGYCSGDPSVDSCVVFASPDDELSFQSVLIFFSGEVFPQTTTTYALGITPCFCI